MTQPPITARGLTKSFVSKKETVHAVRGIDFDVSSGESFGFLGPNGAGKSTTMRMVAATSPRTSGDLTILGLDPNVDGMTIRHHLGVIPQQDNLDESLTVFENLYIYGRYFGFSRAYCRAKAEELIEFASLEAKAKAIVETLSGGMKRRLTIARGLVNDPQLLLLDEPTTGLDPQARHMLWGKLFLLKQAGVTLIVTTHFMDEAEQLCDRLVIMDEGLIAAEGTPKDLIRRYATKEVLELRFAPGGQNEQADIARQHAERVEELPDRLLLYTQNGEATLEECHAAGVRPMSSLIRRASLEDVFLHLTGRSLID